jgi:tRNA nucleotidyltransferase (CCA-adding enzyme)
MADAHLMVRQVSGERLRHELDLILSEIHAVEMINRLAELGLLQAIHPDLEWNSQIAYRVAAVIHHTPGPEWKLPTQTGHISLAQALVYIAWFAYYPSERARNLDELLRMLRMPAALLAAISAATKLVEKLPTLVTARPWEVVEQLESIPWLTLYVLSEIAGSSTEREVLRRYVMEWSKLEPRTNGDTLRAMGIPPGPAYRTILNALRRAWLEGIISSAEQEEIYLEKLLQGIT